jgi:hypothetical protein
MAMSGRERAERALTFEPVDRTPIWGGWTTGANFLEYVGGVSYWDDPWKSIVEAHRKLGVDLFPGEVYGPHSKTEFRSSDFRKVYQEARANFKEPEDVLEYVQKLPDPATLEKEFDFEKFYNEMRRDIEQKQEDLGDDILWLPVFRTCYFNWHWQFGYEPYFMALVLYPGEMKKLFDHAGEVARLDNQMRVQLFRDLRLPPAMFNGVDLCDNRGPMVGVRLLREIYFPNLRRSLVPLVEAGITVIWHSDGNIVPLLDDLIACGVGGFQGFQEETGVELEALPKLKLPTGRKPILWGSMSVSRTLPFGTLEDVKREVERSIDILGPGGGHFLGPSNTIGPEVPFENLLAMHEHARDYGLPRCRPADGPLRS